MIVMMQIIIKFWLIMQTFLKPFKTLGCPTSIPGPFLILILIIIIIIITIIIIIIIIVLIRVNYINHILQRTYTHNIYLQTHTHIYI